MTATDLAHSAPASIDDTLRRLLHHASEVLELARHSPKPFHATRRLDDEAALGFEHETADPAMLRPADLEQASHFPSAKRRDQFLLGRAAANRALALLGGAPVESVGRGPRGEPMWPAGFTGSISHTSSSAISVVLREGRVHVGIDIETLGRRNNDELAEYVIDPRERSELADACRDDDHAFYLGFSIKEAVIKVLRPPLGTSIDFRGVALLDVRAEEHEGVACAWRFGDRGGTARGAVAGGAVCALAAASAPLNQFAAKQ